LVESSLLQDNRVAGKGILIPKRAHIFINSFLFISGFVLIPCTLHKIYGV
jgi:hypothetical protein